jgi:hypothetical protein
MGGYAHVYAAQPDPFLDDLLQPDTLVEAAQLTPVSSEYAAQPDADSGYAAEPPIEPGSGYAAEPPVTPDLPFPAAPSRPAIPAPKPAPRVLGKAPLPALDQMPVPLFKKNVNRVQRPAISVVKDRIGFWNNRLRPAPRLAPLLRPAAEYANEERDQNIKYAKTQWSRRKYEVSMGAVLRRNGEIFDTLRIKSFYVHKSGRNAAAKLAPADRIAAAERRDGKRRAPIASAVMYDRALQDDWQDNGLIWVCAMEHGRARPTFYSSIGKHSTRAEDPHGFKHSSFKAGGAVICAGEWVVSKGKLLKVSANSGHYRPPIDYLHRAVMYMTEAWNDDTVVLLWNIKKKAWEEVPVLMFRDNPTYNGTYRAHPEG